MRAVLVAAGLIVAAAVTTSIPVDTLLTIVQAAGYLAIAGGLLALVVTSPAHVCYFPHRHPSGVWRCRCGATRDRHGNDPAMTTYWYDGQQVTAHDYAALRDRDDHQP